MSGQGEIRTLDTGFTGMPVFETGAFNHSATCPGAPQVIRENQLIQPDQRVGIRRCTALMIVLDGSRLGVMYGLSTFEISSLTVCPAGTTQKLP